MKGCFFGITGADMKEYINLVLQQLITIINRPHTPKTLQENTGKYLCSFYFVPFWSGKKERLFVLVSGFFLLPCVSEFSVIHLYILAVSVFGKVLIFVWIFLVFILVHCICNQTFSWLWLCFICDHYRLSMVKVTLAILLWPVWSSEDHFSFI